MVEGKASTGKLCCVCSGNTVLLSAVEEHLLVVHFVQNGVIQKGVFFNVPDPCPNFCSQHQMDVAQIHPSPSNVFHLLLNPLPLA